MVSNATVKVRNLATNDERTVSTKNDGSYQVADLAIGTYEVSFSKDGFETEVHSQVAVQGNRTVTVNGSLQPGQVSSTVTVNGTPLLDETDDNIDVYAQHRTDMRKGLKLVIEADSEWQLNLRQLKEQSPADELPQYAFVLANAIDTVADSAKSSREALEEQNKLAAEKKLNKDYSERKD